MKNLVAVFGLVAMVGVVSGCGGTTVETDTATVKNSGTETSVTSGDASVNVGEDEVHVTGGGASVDVNSDGSVNIKY